MTFRRSFPLGLMVTLVLSLASAACGGKGDGEPEETPSGGMTGAGGSGAGNTSGTTGGTSSGPEVLFGFDADTEGFAWDLYSPDDPTYVNVPNETGAESMLTWDGGTGSDGEPGRLKLSVPFDDYNQLADIQINVAVPEDWTGKTVRVRIMIESGFSPDASAPGGAYIFLKTGADYVWGKGNDLSLPPTTVGEWGEAAFPVASPVQTNSGFDPSQVVSLGVQFYTGGGGDGLEPPSATVAYVDAFSLE